MVVSRFSLQLMFVRHLKKGQRGLYVLKSLPPRHSLKILNLPSHMWEKQWGRRSGVEAIAHFLGNDRAELI